ncbi:hypothetical protein MMC27_007538 [Xylographa pallens]|nr:hypothetical protein [Xylographa pallens]
MDPLSVSVSIVGLLTAAASVTAFLQNFVHGVGDAPKLARTIIAEVTGIGTCLAQLQSFLVGIREVSSSRTSIVMVEQVLVTLTACVTNFSDLEKVLDTLKGNHPDGPSGAMDRIRWTMKEQTISSILSRLQMSKSSLNLMLTTLSCFSMEEARQSSKELHGLIQQTLASNTNISNRLRNLEIWHDAKSTLGSMTRNSIAETADDNETVRPHNLEEGISQPVTPIMQAMTIGFAFEHDLQASRVYARAALRNSSLSLPSSAVRSVGWSVLSGMSLAEISNISVFSLPIAREELYNSQDYELEEENNAIDDSGYFSDNSNVDSVRILILGDTRSGKSTIFKQFQLLGGCDFDLSDRYDAIPQIRNILEFAVDHMRHCLYMIYQKTDKGAKFEKEISEGNSYLSDFERLLREDYLPSDRDILGLWTPSFGICDRVFKFEEVKYHVFDVCGEKEKRNMWESAFDMTDCVIVTVALSGYNEIIGEPTVNALQESLMLFEKLVNDRRLATKPFFLTLTKLDLFKNKLMHDPMSKYWPDFKGGCDCDKAREYWIDRFRSLKQHSKPQLHIQYATSIASFTTNIRDMQGVVMDLPFSKPLLNVPFDFEFAD